MVSRPLLNETELELHRVWFEPALTDDDREWIRRQLELAGVKPPTVDLSWVTVDMWADWGYQ